MSKLHCYSNGKSICGIGAFADLTTDWQHVTCKRCLIMYKDIKVMKEYFNKIKQGESRGKNKSRGIAPKSIRLDK